MTWLPTASTLVVQLAVLLEMVTAAQPAMLDPPLRNATVPVMGEPLEAIVATKVTDCPKVVLLIAAVSVVVVLAAETVCARSVDVLVENDVVPA